jgi:hypothetical protein
MMTKNCIPVQIMNANSQAQQGCIGRAGGIPNYKNIKDGPPLAGIEFNDGGGGKVGEENIKLATANIAVNEVISGECAEGAAEVHPCPPSLPAFGSGRVSNTAATAVLSSGGRGDHSQNLQPAARRSLSSMSYTSGEGSKGNIKNSTNHKWGSISKALDRIAQSLESRRRGSESNMMMLMLLMHMQQTAQQIQMQSAIKRRLDTARSIFGRLQRL